MSSTLVMGLLIIAILLGAVGASGAIYNFQNAPDIVTPDKYDWRAVGAGTMIDWLNANFVSENEWKPHNMELTEIFQQLDKKVDGLQSSVTLLQAKGDVTTQPLPTPPVTSTINLELTVSDNKGNTKSSYPRDVPAILIQGQSVFIDKTYIITIQAPDGNFVKDKFSQTLSDGDISEAWIPSNALVGQYTITITINARTDTITFILI